MNMNDLNGSNYEMIFSDSTSKRQHANIDGGVYRSVRERAMPSASGQAKISPLSRAWRLHIVFVGRLLG